MGCESSKNLQKSEHLCYDMVMTEPIREDPHICTCEESYAGVVIAFHGVIEHHCWPPSLCWSERRPVIVEK